MDLAASVRVARRMLERATSRSRGGVFFAQLSASVAQVLRRRGGNRGRRHVGLLGTHSRSLDLWGWRDRCHDLGVGS
jgi:hypothetical protein